MILAILSDSHDHLDYLGRALERARSAGAQAIIHAGDFVSPFSLNPFQDWEGELYAVLGNNDGEREGLRRRFASLGAHYYEGPVQFKSAAQLQASPERPTLLISGHTHQPLLHREGALWLLNPGECCGWLSKRPTMALFDSASRQAQLLELA